MQISVGIISVLWSTSRIFMMRKEP